MSLNYRVERCRMLAMVRVDFTAAYPDSMNLYKDLMITKLFWCWSRYIAQFDLMLVQKYNLSHII